MGSAPHWRPLMDAMPPGEGELEETPSGVWLRRPHGSSAAQLATVISPDSERLTIFADGDSTRASDRIVVEDLIERLPSSLRRSFRFVMAHADDGGPRAYGQWLANRFGSLVSVASDIPAIAWECTAPILPIPPPAWVDFHPQDDPPFPPGRLCPDPHPQHTPVPHPLSAAAPPPVPNAAVRDTGVFDEPVRDSAASALNEAAGTGAVPPLAAVPAAAVRQVESDVMVWPKPDMAVPPMPDTAVSAWLGPGVVPPPVSEPMFESPVPAQTPQAVHPVWEATSPAEPVPPPMTAPPASIPPLAGAHVPALPSMVSAASGLGTGIASERVRPRDTPPAPGRAAADIAVRPPEIPAMLEVPPPAPSEIPGMVRPPTVAGPGAVREASRPVATAVGMAASPVHEASAGPALVRGPGEPPDTGSGAAGIGRRAERVPVRPVVPRGHQSSADERRLFRERAGERRGRHLVAVARVLTERPALRGAMSMESEEAIATDLSALRAYLSGDLPGLDAALRNGDTEGARGDVACVVSALRLLASYRGPAYSTADLTDEEASCYPVGHVLLEPGFTTATSNRPRADGNALYTIWSRTSRRVAPLAVGDDPGTVLFAAGTAFTVLVVERAEERWIIHLDERTRPGAYGALTDAELMVGQRLRSALAKDAPAKGLSRYGPPLCVDGGRCYVPA